MIAVQCTCRPLCLAGKTKVGNCKGEGPTIVTNERLLSCLVMSCSVSSTPLSLIGSLSAGGTGGPASGVSGVSSCSKKLRS